MTAAKTKDMGSGSVAKLLLQLALPAVVAQVVNLLYNIVDRIYIGHMAEVGAAALTGVGLFTPILMLLTAFAMLCGAGGAPRAAIAMGRGDNDAAEQIMANCFTLLLILAAVLTAVFYFAAPSLLVMFGASANTLPFALDYARIYILGSVFVLVVLGMNPFVTTQGFAAFSMLTTVIGAVCNIILDPIFIFVLDMGVRGSSLATVISQLFSCACVVVFFFSKRSLFHFRVREMLPTWARVRDIVSLGFTPFVMTLTECAIQIVFNINLNRATGGNKDYTAALTVMLSALQLITLPLNGLGTGMQPFVSYNYGRGDAKRLTKGIRYVTVIAFIFCAVIWSVSMAVPQVYAYIFSASDTVTDIVRRYTPMFLMGSIMFFVQMTLQNINVGLGQARLALMLAVNRKVVILIPLCFVLTHFMGFKGVYLSEGVADLVAGIITAIVIFTSFPRIFRRRAAEVQAQRERESAAAQ